MVQWKIKSLKQNFQSCFIITRQEKGFYIKELFKKHNNKLIFVQSKKKRFAAGNNVGIKYILQNDPKSFCWMLKMI